MTKTTAVHLMVWLVLLASCSSNAREMTLTVGQEYEVPDNKVWVIKSTAPAPCNICTADVYISGEVSNVEIAGVIMHGDFDFSITDEHHQEVILYGGTHVSVGDSRQKLVVEERPKE